ncbi:putative fasciclin-like arabinogalactan protein 20 [Telopea speciosissima]|uniref:putative fasciclin-like arabinogalactan protein 20 n=1 Tax=Telopea speciosissima TaxID=54955 RepID=UPI001CC7D311|nr:putative fasciclin-like arabinogalactan protein 20 [Telopea speciosissima]
MTTLSQFSLILFSLFCTSVLAIQPETVQDAVEILADTGFMAMSLTIQLVAQALISNLSYATIFSPADAAFIQSGQPSIDLLQYHISPLAFSVETLRTLPYGTKIPTLYQNHSLMVTTPANGQQISLNNVKINESTIFDDGSLVVFGIDKFFDPSFSISSHLPPIGAPTSNFYCTAPYLHDSALDFESFVMASNSIRDKGYSVMASFLELQLPQSGDQKKLTIFAPVDEAIEDYKQLSGENSTVFHRHGLPCKLTWSDLVMLDDGATLETLLRGFRINVTRSGITVLLNGVPVIFPDLYYHDWLVIHGIPQILSLPAEQEPVRDSYAGFNGNFKGNVPDSGEF